MTGADALVLHAARSGRPFASAIAVLPFRFRPPASVDMPFLPNNFPAEQARVRVNIVTSGPEPGNWLIAIDNDVCRVLTGSVPAPDARLYTDSDVGHAIISGRLPLEEALESRLLDYDGDPGRLALLRSCFRFGESL